MLVTDAEEADRYPLRIQTVCVDLFLPCRPNSFHFRDVQTPPYGDEKHNITVFHAFPGASPAYPLSPTLRWKS